MAVATSTEKFASTHKLVMYDHDPGATSAVICSPDGGTTLRSFDMRDFENFVAFAKPTIVGGNGITLFEIVAATDSGLTANVTQIKTSGAVTIEGLDDYIFLECSAAELAQASTDAGLSTQLRYVGARLTNATNTDEVAVGYLGFNPRFSYTGMTATTDA